MTEPITPDPQTTKPETPESRMDRLDEALGNWYRRNIAGHKMFWMLIAIIGTLFFLELNADAPLILRLIITWTIVFGVLFTRLAEKFEKGEVK